MTVLQFIVIVSSVIFILFAYDAFKRRKLNILHFFVFVFGSIILMLFGTNQNLLDKFGNFFGVARGADLLVYLGIILLGWFYFELLHSFTKYKYKLTKLIIQMSINSNNIDISNIDKDQTDKSKFVFLIRAYNEGKTIGIVIDDIIANGFSKIVIVNDGSKDNTMEIIEKKKKQYSDKSLIVLSHIIRRGGGAANKTGFAFLKKYKDALKIDWFVTFDGDGQMGASDMSNFISEINKLDSTVYHNSMLLGTRFKKGGSVEQMPTMRKIILLGSRVITLLFNGIWLSDPHNGYRVISVKSLDNLKIYSDGMTYASELIDNIKVQKMNCIETPVHIKYTEYSLGKGQKNSNAIKILIDLIYKKLFFR